MKTLFFLISLLAVSNYTEIDKSLLYGIYISSEDDSIFLFLHKRDITMRWDDREISLPYKTEIVKGETCLVVQQSKKEERIVVESVDSIKIVLRSLNAFSGVWQRIK